MRLASSPSVAMCKQLLTLLFLHSASWTGSALQLVGGSDRATGPIPVDFFVFLGSDGAEHAVPPKASMNIADEDNATGFFRMCSDKCPIKTVQHETYTAPEMRWCRCIAELLVADLSQDFGQLSQSLPDVSQTPLFQIGSYEEVDAGQGFFDVSDGHGLLRQLLYSGPDKAFYRRPERLTVWVSQHIQGHQPGTVLAGTTLLDQVLYADGPGAGVLLSGRISRMGHRLSHEVGHVVGFHHVAGPPVSYTYTHPRCPAPSRVLKWKMVSGPSCEVNIMGGWYDGPYCCPSFLQGEWTQRQPCLQNSKQSPRSSYCCGSACNHNCPAENPPMTFATEEHTGLLTNILHCWLHLRGKAMSDGGQGTVFSSGHFLGSQAVREEKPQTQLECVDYDSSVGPCTEMTHSNMSQQAA
eukprot:TRINITY_DN28401_c0_g1_i1.p1 TRINITY_DN28401_c0_g1~~TRINITY_DN28401_c0_g1_i1.p1  ORF type:complete len:410 (-),score=32.32 TRINITY_DN28401_c0_g1_i1:254-1483(-)